MFILFCSLSLLFFLHPSPTSARVKGTKHDLSITGTGTVKAVSETQICVFCHTPHNANPSYPLWNHELSAVATYTPYFSDTLQSYDSPAGAPPVEGASKLCLSCHDGTVAISSVQSGFINIIMSPSPCLDAGGRLTETADPSCSGYIGTDLSGGHPISIVFDEALMLKRNSDTEFCKLNLPPNRLTEPDVRLDRNSKVQCTACHNPHGSKAVTEWPPFWQKADHDSVCLVCHVDCVNDWSW